VGLPGFTASNIRNAALNKNATPQGASPMDESEMMTAEECAALILRAIEKGNAHLFLPQMINALCSSTG
jgi:hypothetical protein